MIKALNLGCGEGYKKSSSCVEWVNLDISKEVKADVYCNLNKLPWDFFKDDEFDEVYCSHILEHVDDLIKVMTELKRICRNEAIIRIRAPHFSCGVSYRDPTHKRLFSYFTFDYFTEDTFYGLPTFKIKNRSFNFTRTQFTFLNVLINPILNNFPMLYERFFCWVFPTSEVLFDLEVKK